MSVNDGPRRELTRQGFTNWTMQWSLSLLSNGFHGNDVFEFDHGYLVMVDSFLRRCASCRDQCRCIRQVRLFHSSRPTSHTHTHTHRHLHQSTSVYKKDTRFISLLNIAVNEDWVSLASSGCASVLQTTVATHRLVLTNTAVPRPL